MMELCLRCTKEIEEGQKTYGFSGTSPRLGERMHRDCYKAGLADIDNIMTLFKKEPVDPTKCKNGHDREGNTLYDSNGYRYCGICSRESMERHQAKKRLQAARQRYGALY